MSQNSVVVIGAGVMGQGLAQTIATKGGDVLVVDENEAKLKSALGKINDALDAEIARYGLTDSEKRAIQARITTSIDIKKASGAGLIVETIPEKLEAKRALFTKLESTCSPATVFVSNTATLSITEIAADAKQPDRVIGMHFLNPVPKTGMVEIMRGMKTSDFAFSTAVDFARSIGKTPIHVFEFPGSVSTRLIIVMINEAIKAFSEGICSCEEIDTAMKLGFGFNQGPFALADRMGIKTIIGWMENLYKETHDPVFVPHRFLRKMVRAGLTGMKVGSGFYKYDENGCKIENGGLKICDLSINLPTEKGR